MFIGIYKKMLMALDRDDNKPIFNVPSLLKPSTARNFIAKYKELLTQANLFQKVKDISDRMETASDTEKISHLKP